MAKKLSIVILGLTPLFFLPTAQNFYDTNKWMLLSVGALLVLIIWAVALFRVKTPLRAALPWGALGFAVLTLASLVGLIAASTNKIEALLSPLGPVTFAALTILILAGSSMTKQDKMYLRRVLYTVTGLVGLIALYQALGMGKLVLPQVQFLADPLWTPTGSVTTTIALFFITLSLVIPDAVTSFKKHQEHGAVALLVISLIIIAIGTTVTLSQFILKAAGVLPFDVGMVVASQIFKNSTSAAAGVGAENFVTAFTFVRPASLNTGPLANVIFATNADFFLHILTVYGLTGLAGALILVGNLVSGNKKEWLFFTKCLCIASLLLIPPTIPLLAVIAIILILAEGDRPAPKPITVKPSWIRISAGILLMLVTAGSFYFLIRAYTAEVYFFRSLRAAQANDGTKTYNRQIQAIRANTFLSRYHISYSQTSLALANSIATSLNNPSASSSAGTNTDQNRQLVGQLMQQAVTEAKIAVTLNTTNIAAWENLGLTYQAIIPVATDAANWALTAYQTAVKLDPSNPNLFVNIGSVFVTQNQYDNAIAVFERAIQLAPSYANAYYNLANVYKLKGDTVNQAKVLTNTLKLVTPESSDYAKIKNELDALQHTTTP
ncbi:MAG: tetratricopeptide repeat protein [Candidatus Gottesmanbacteria bacterium]|nr:tetratricopeptide repeat protein [Candidatus Gottesmanbacteria bacterium]